MTTIGKPPERIAEKLEDNQYVASSRRFSYNVNAYPSHA